MVNVQGKGYKIEGNRLSIFSNDFFDFNVLLSEEPGVNLDDITEIYVSPDVTANIDYNINKIDEDEELYQFGFNELHNLEKIYCNASSKFEMDLSKRRIECKDLEKYVSSNYAKYLIKEEGLDMANTSIKEFKGYCTQIPSNTFEGCLELTTFIAPQLECVEHGLLLCCLSLKDVDISKATKIDFYAFSNCINLRNIDISNVKEIKAHAFDGCESLQEIDVTNATNIELAAFDNCPNLESIKVPAMYKIVDGKKQLNDFYVNMIDNYIKRIDEIKEEKWMYLDENYDDTEYEGREMMSDKKRFEDNTLPIFLKTITEVNKNNPEIMAQLMSKELLNSVMSSYWRLDANTKIEYASNEDVDASVAEITC